jgi:hypothetical protein
LSGSARIFGGGISSTGAAAGGCGLGVGKGFGVDSFTCIGIPINIIV